MDQGQGVKQQRVLAKHGMLQSLASAKHSSATSHWLSKQKRVPSVADTRLADHSAPPMPENRVESVNHGLVSSTGAAVAWHCPMRVCHLQGLGFRVYVGFQF